jgi:hypothetical protein
LQQRGLLYTLGLFARSWEAIRQNRRIASGLKAGDYWNHTRDEFTGAFIRAGYEILRSCPVYRDYSLVVVARKRSGPVPAGL